MIYQNLLKRDSFDDRKFIMTCERNILQHKIAREEILKERALHVIEMEKTQKWCQEMIPIHTGMVPKWRVPNPDQKINGSEEDLIPPIIFRIGADQLGFVDDEIDEDALPQYGPHQVTNIKLIQEKVKEEHDKLGFFSRKFDMHLEGELEMMAARYKRKRILVKFPLSPIFHELDEDEQRQVSRLV